MAPEPATDPTSCLDGRPWRACPLAGRNHGPRLTTVRARAPSSVDADWPAVPVQALEPGRPLTRAPAEEVPRLGLPDGKQDRCRVDQRSAGEPGRKGGAPPGRARDGAQHDSAREKPDQSEQRAGDQLLNRLDRHRRRPCVVDQAEGDVVDTQYDRKCPNPSGFGESPSVQRDAEPVHAQPDQDRCLDDIGRAVWDAPMERRPE